MHGAMLLAAPTIATAANLTDGAQSGGDVLRMVLDSDTLLFGCIAFALLAVVTLSKVASRRRKDRQVRRASHAQTKAIHEFLETVRAGSGTARQGVWHYDFGTGAEQFSEELLALLQGREIDFARLAREHEGETQPYEAHFTLRGSEDGERSFRFHACNLPGPVGHIQRAVAIVREIEPETGARATSD